MNNQFLQEVRARVLSDLKAHIPKAHYQRWNKDGSKFGNVPEQQEDLDFSIGFELLTRSNIDSLAKTPRETLHNSA